MGTMKKRNKARLPWIRRSRNGGAGAADMGPGREQRVCAAIHETKKALNHKETEYGQFAYIFNI